MGFAISDFLSSLTMTGVAVGSVMTDTDLSVGLLLGVVLGLLLLVLLLSLLLVHPIF